MSKQRNSVWVLGGRFVSMHVVPRSTGQWELRSLRELAVDPYIKGAADLDYRTLVDQGQGAGDKSRETQ